MPSAVSARFLASRTTVPAFEVPVPEHESRAERERCHRSEDDGHAKPRFSRSLSPGRDGYQRSDPLDTGEHQRHLRGQDHPRSTNEQDEWEREAQQSESRVVRAREVRGYEERAQEYRQQPPEVHRSGFTSLERDNVTTIVTETTARPRNNMGILLTPA